MARIKALIFDLDGTLFNSREANVLSYNQAFKRAKLTFNKKLYLKCFGLRYKEMMNKIAPTATEEQLKIIRKEKKRFYGENINKIQPNCGLLALINAVRGLFQIALVTTASGENVNTILQNYKISSLFDVVIVGEDVNEGKPSPECYQKAINKLGLKPNQCLVFEDSDFGIQAVKNARMNNIIKIVM